MRNIVAVRFLSLLVALSAVACLSDAPELYDFDGDGTPDSTDCAPEDPAVYPEAEDEAGDGVDQNCDGTDGVDADGDGYPSIASGGDDCNDDNAEVHPGATEVFDDSIDNDCNGLDASCDDDGDGFVELSCEGGTDCDDDNSEIHPEAEELCDGVDNNCDGAPFDGEQDNDSDGVLACEGDCDDSDQESHPGAEDATVDGTDQDCSGVDGIDADGDGIASEASGGQDCDDTNEDAHPGAEDLWGDDLDLNCDGVDGIDADGDGHASNSGSAAQDCDDNNAGVYPGSTELWESPAQALDVNCDGDLYTSLAQADWGLTGGAEGDRAGLGFSAVADLDLDGGHEVLVGARYADYDGESNSGVVYLIRSSTLEAAGPTITFPLPDADLLIYGADSAPKLGISVTSGDVDGDGSPDLFLAAEDYDATCNDCGKSYLFFGADLPASGELAAEDADLSIIGADDDEAGHCVAVAGDIDADGLDDLLVANYQYDNYRGRTGLFLGSTLSAQSQGAQLDLVDADRHFIGEDQDDRSGLEVASAGDVDGDGKSDLLLGAPLNDEFNTHSGKAYLFFGSDLTAAAPGASFELSDSSSHISILGSTHNAELGYGVAGAGAIDGDGKDEVVVGAHMDDLPNGLRAGKAYLFWGATLAATSLGTTLDSLAADIQFLGEDAGDEAGHAVNSAGDVDGDGYADLIIGADNNADGGTDAGKAYLYLASTLATQPSGAELSLSNADYAFIGEGSEAFAGSHLAPAGDVNADGLDDLLIGAPLHRAPLDNQGRVYLLLSPF